MYLDSFNCSILLPCTSLRKKIPKILVQNYQVWPTSKLGHNGHKRVTHQWILWIGSHIHMCQIGDTFPVSHIQCPMTIWMEMSILQVYNHAVDWNWSIIIWSGFEFAKNSSIQHVLVIKCQIRRYSM